MQRKATDAGPKLSSTGCRDAVDDAADDAAVAGSGAAGVVDVVVVMRVGGSDRRSTAI